MWRNHHQPANNSLVLKVFDVSAIYDDDEDDDDAEEDMEKRIAVFAADLGVATRQQLGKKRKRLGHRGRQKKLDPALQVCPTSSN